jgi:hypothetical protein
MKTHFKKRNGKIQKHQEEIGTNMAIVMFMVEAETTFPKKRGRHKQAAFEIKLGTQELIPTKKITSFKHKTNAFQAIKS